MAVEASIVGPSIGVVPFVVIVSDDQNDEAIAQGDEDVLVALSTLAGTYWPVHGIEVGGRQVWKQADAVWPAKKPMVCYYEATGEVGWWFCTAVADSKARKQLDDDMIIAAYAAPTATMPEHVHVPYWKKKPTGGIAITPLCVWYEQQIEQLTMAIIDKEGGGGGSGTSGSGDGSGSSNGCGSGGGGGGGGGNNSKGGDHDKAQPNRGGWLPRVSVLVAQILDKKWSDVTSTAWKWYSEYPLLKKLADKQFKASKKGW